MTLPPTGGSPGFAEGAHTETPTATSRTEQAKAEAADVTATTRDEAASVAGDAKAEAQQVAQHAADQARDVANEATAHARELFDTTRSELTGQANTAQSKLAELLRTLTNELDSMVAGAQDQRGLASEAASTLGSQTGRAADFLESRDFPQVVDEVSNFARRRPGTFLLGAALTGLVAGRLTRGMTASPDTSATTPTPVARYGEYPVGGTPVGREPVGVDTVGVAPVAPVGDAAFGYPPAQPAGDPVFGTQHVDTNAGTDTETGTVPGTPEPAVPSEDQADAVLEAVDFEGHHRREERR